jgi:hypothetical protein
MPRSRSRVCLQDGLKLELNRLTRKGFIRRGCYCGVRGIKWTNSYWGEVASALISADLSSPPSGWLKLEGGLNQFILLAAQPRRYGGHQWYFVCPVTGRPTSVLWRPPGAKQFCSRQAWGRRRVAYASQFLDRDNRAHHGQSSPSRTIQAQITALRHRRARPRGVGLATQAQVDALEDLSTIRSAF